MATFIPEGTWISGTQARNAHTGERFDLGGMAGRLDYHIYDQSELALDMRGFAGPNGVAVAYVFKGEALFDGGSMTVDGALPAFSTFELSDQPSFVDLTSPRGNYLREVSIYGGAGGDVVWSGDGNDRIDGRGGDDRLFGGAGNDVIFGGPGADRIIGWTGGDSLLGNAYSREPADRAQDVFVFHDGLPGGNGFDIIRNFEDGYDRIDLSDFHIEDRVGFLAERVVNDGASSTVKLREDGYFVVYYPSGTTGTLDGDDFIF